MPPTTRAEDALTGILLVDKPSGWTSHDVVAKVRGVARQRQIGHTGTLDPMATGLLVLCLGRATRLVEYMTGHDKAYEGVIRLGAATNTDDGEGDVIREAAVPPLSDTDLRDLEARFTGVTDQIPPAFSAIKVGGQRAYAVARKGGAPDLQARPVRIHSLELAAEGPDGLRIRVVCGAGTYIRSLARDIGEALGSAAHLGELRRTGAGWFRVEEALPLATIAALDREGLAELLLPLDEGVTDLGAAILTDARAAEVSQGGRIRVPGERRGDAVRVYSVGGSFVAIGSIGEDERLSPQKVFTV